MPNARIVLIGFRATGKTTVGHLLSEALGLPFVDLDTYLEGLFGQSIAQIVEEKGWDYFRTQEKAALKEMASRRPLVLACGGGAVLHQDEMERLAQDSLVIWLKASKEVLAKRLAQDTKTAAQRPALKGKDPLCEIEAVLAEREPLYQRFAHIVLDTDQLLPQEVVEKILQALDHKATV